MSEQKPFFKLPGKTRAKIKFRMHHYYTNNPRLRKAFLVNWGSGEVVVPAYTKQGARNRAQRLLNLSKIKPRRMRVETLKHLEEWAQVAKLEWYLLHEIEHEMRVIQQAGIKLTLPCVICNSKNTGYTPEKQWCHSCGRVYPGHQCATCGRHDVGEIHLNHKMLICRLQRMPTEDEKVAAAEADAIKHLMRLDAQKSLKSTDVSIEDRQ